MLLPGSIHGGEWWQFSPFTAAQNAGTPAAEERDPRYPTSERVTVRPDSVRVVHKHSVRPATALYHSLFISGWGQLNNGKKMKAALFFTAEIVCIGGYLYYNNELRQAGYSELERDNLRFDRNTYLLSFLAAKFFGMVDAYVDAHLADFNVRDITPEELKR